MKDMALGLAVVVSLVLSGCTLDPGEEPIDEGLPATVISVTHAQLQRGGCPVEGHGDGYCHLVEVSVDNTNNGRDFSTGRLHWDARDEDGGVYETPATEGPDAVAAEGSGEVLLKFDIDEQGVRLVRLHYGHFGTELWADIPSYV